MSLSRIVAFAAWGHFEKTKFSTICGDTRRYVRTSWIGRGASVWHVLPVMDDCLTTILYSLWWMRFVAEVGVSLGDRSGEMAARARCRCLWLGVHSAQTLATWLRMRGCAAAGQCLSSCCQRSAKKRKKREENEKKKREKEHTQTPTPQG